MVAYREWVGRAVGWWTILYLIFWLVIFVIAGLETLTPLEDPLPSPRLVLMGLGAVLFASLVLAGRTPPVILDRRDLYRLGLGPVVPWTALRWRYGLKVAGAAAVGALGGAVWSLLAPPLFGITAPWAAPALALLMAARFGGSWLRYAGNDSSGSREAWGFIAVGVVLAVVPGGLSSAFLSASPFTLIAPLALAALSLFWVRRSLAELWPPRFAPQSLVLTQLQAMRTMQLIAGVAGFLRQAQANAGERRRLLAALHDKPGATKPRRSLPLPAVELPVWRAFAWRTASYLWRLPRLRQVGAFLLALVAASMAVLVYAPEAAATLSGTAEGAGGAAGLFGGALGVLIAAVMVARAGSSLLGPEFAIGALPVEGMSRTNGRVFPSLVLLAALSLPAVFYFSPPPGALLGAVTLVLLVVLALEKYSSWSGTGASRWEPQIIAALLAALPSLLLGALGVPEWTLMVQVGVLFVVTLISV